MQRFIRNPLHTDIKLLEAREARSINYRTGFLIFMASEVFQLAILLTLKDMASGGLDRIEAKLRSAGKEGVKFAEEFQSVRESLNRDLAIGGIGVAGLSALYKGVKAAGDFQATMTDLKATLATSSANGTSVDMTALGADMLKAEAIAVKLGNALPGTTADFVEMMQVLKQNGLQTETIMNGAAEAVAHLAVANNAMPKEVAADFAQYGNLFKLKAEDFAPAADVFSRIYTSTGQTSGELVEAAKYFQGRSGTLLGIGGLKDAEQITRLFGLMGKQGIRGSMAGTSLTDMMSQYGKAIQPDKSGKSKVDELQAATGIKLNFFDDKGNFAGVDKIFEQMKQFDKLSDKDRSGWLEEIFGLRGMTAANVFLQTGAEGWKTFNAEQNKTISQTDKVAMKSATFNNQLEALGGTMTNLKVTIFEPMLPGLTSAIDKTNEFVGSIQEFAKANPELSKTVITLAALASSAMVLYSGFKTLTTGVKLFQMASALRGDGLLNYLNQTTTAAETAGTSITTATTKARGLRGALQSQTVKIGVQIGAIMGIEFLIGVIQREIQTAFDAGTAKKNAVEATNKNYAAYQREKQSGTQFSPDYYKDQANTSWFAAMKGGLSATLPSERAKLPFISFLGNPSKVSQDASERELYPLTKLAGATNPFQTGLGGGHNRDSLAQGFQKTAPQLAEPAIMAQLLKQLDARLPNNQERNSTREALAQAFPDSFTKAIAELSALNVAPLTQSFADLSTQMSTQAQAQTNNTEFITQFGTTLNELQTPFSTAKENVSNLGDSASKSVSPLNGVGTSARNAVGGLDSLGIKFANYQIPVPNVQTVSIGVPQAAAPLSPASTGFSIFPSHAVGGVVERDGVAMVHAGNIITPARTKGFGVVESLFKNSANRTSSFAAELRQSPNLLLPNLQETSDSFPNRAIGGISERGKQTAEARRILSQSSSQNVSVNYSPNITINGDSKTAKQDFQQMLNSHSKEIERLVTRQMQNGRARA